jgi:hypothetical protein
MDVVVQPSVSWMGLNDQIKDSGLLPVDPGPPVSIYYVKIDDMSLRVNYSGQSWWNDRDKLQVSY